MIFQAQSIINLMFWAIKEEASFGRRGSKVGKLTKTGA
jgi:hypothetical protein